ncbi:MAG: methionine--tRNA ligase [Phycisphaeraceae bacterium]|nr:methionine--tRNA ligase [Phycisphaeraceae bacterium]
MKKLLVTSALPYANGPIHIGHLVEYIQTDIWVRYWKLRGRDTIYICADDTHGTPIMLRAQDEQVEPEALIERMGEEHRRDFADFQVHFDNYYTTHSPENEQLSGEIYLALKEGGHISERSIEQAHCPQCRMFLPDRYVRGTCPKCGAEEQYGDACEVCSSTYNPRDLIDPYCATCGTQPDWKESVHLFFELDHFTDALRAWIGAGHVQDDIRKKLMEWFQDGLRAWDISRDAPYFGFEIPGQPDKYFYVWLDAPVGYMAATMDHCRRHGLDFDAYWRRDDESDVYHFIGKDIVYFHALFWPAMLMGSGFRTPTQLCVHGFLTVNHEKMSKSRGTFITARTYLDHLDPQYLRYYYASKLNPRVEDLDLSLEDFVQRVNADLVNKIANIPSRVLAILHRNCDGRLAHMDDEGRALFDQLRGKCDAVGALYEQRDYAQVARLIGELTGEINTYLQAHKPWQLVKEDTARAAVVCTAGLNAFRIIATLIAPILPEFADRVASMLEIDALTWAGLDDVLENRPVRPYERLVDRVDPKKITAMTEASRVTTDEQEEVEPPVMTLDGLVDCAFQTMRLLDASPIADTDKLLALTLEDGDAPRRIVAGLGHDALDRGIVGQNFLVLANLAPKKIRGNESHGMSLAGDAGDRPQPVFVPDRQSGEVVE